MSIPKEVKIGALTYTVVLDPTLSAERGLFGEMCPLMQRINIEANATAEQQEQTLLHEIIEAINNNCELNLEHNQIQTLGFVLHQILKENELSFE